MEGEADLHLLLEHELIAALEGRNKASVYPNPPAEALEADEELQEELDNLLGVLPEDLDNLDLGDALNDSIGKDGLRDKPYPTSGLERHAIDQLDWDLRLSRRVLIHPSASASAVEPPPVSGPLELTDECLVAKGRDDALDTLAQAPENPVFNYLLPLKKESELPVDLHQPEGSTADNEYKLGQLLLGDGARLVLADWQLGEPISASVYPARLGRPGRRSSRSVSAGPISRASSAASGAEESFGRRSTSEVTQKLGIDGSSQPPEDRSSARNATPSFSQPLPSLVSQPAYPLRSQPIGAFSQPGGPGPSANSQTFAYSQEPATQTLPGQHGGRPKKKKKRLGGF